MTGLGRQGRIRHLGPVGSGPRRRLAFVMVMAGMAWLVGFQVGHVAGGSATVSIQDGCFALQDGCFAPSTITVTVGTSVRWNNNGNVDHDVTPLNGGFAASGTLASGESFTTVLTTPGSFPYECSIHEFQGTVIVTASPTPTPRPTPKATPPATPRPTPRATPPATPLPTTVIVVPSVAPSPAGTTADPSRAPSVLIAPVDDPKPPGRSPITGPPRMGSSLSALLMVLGLDVGFTLILVVGSRRRTLREEPASRSSPGPSLRL